MPRSRSGGVRAWPLRVARGPETRRTSPTARPALCPSGTDGAACGTGDTSPWRRAHRLAMTRTRGTPPWVSPRAVAQGGAPPPGRRPRPPGERRRISGPVPGRPRTPIPPTTPRPAAGRPYDPGNPARTEPALGRPCRGPVTRPRPYLTPGRHPCPDHPGPGQARPAGGHPHGPARATPCPAPGGAPARPAPGPGAARPRTPRGRRQSASSSR